MVREDILAALHNAIERSESLEDAKQSLINAGYSAQEVEEASSALISEEKEAELVLPVIKEIPADISARTIPVPAPSQIIPRENIFKKIISIIKKDRILSVLLAVLLISVIVFVITFFLMPEK